MALPPTGTCEVSTVGCRSGRSRRVEIWYVVVTGRIVLTGTPGIRHWLANLREHPEAVLHLREPAGDLAVTAVEVTDQVVRRHVAEQAWLLKPWYAQQPYSVDDWVSRSPMVILTPAQPARSALGEGPNLAAHEPNSRARDSRGRDALLVTDSALVSG